MPRKPKIAERLNAALIADFAVPGFVEKALSTVGVRARTWLVSDDLRLLPDVPVARRISLDQAALTHIPMDPEEAFVRLGRTVTEAAGIAVLVVDMGWVVGNMQGVTGLENWGGLADRLAAHFDLPVISLYNQDVTIEEQIQTALRSHRQFLAPSGIYSNPFWIPPSLLESGALDEQLSFLLGRVVPDYAGLLARRQQGQMFARGATPSWLAPPRASLVSPSKASRWHVHCLGPLRVMIGTTEVNWQLPGGAPKKTRTLFAYLLQCGEKGAHADRIGELLWPEGQSEEVKRTRLHHTVAMLRKTLGDTKSVERLGEIYRLNPPPGSWIDIDTFEQLCRRGLSLYKRGELNAAIRVYAAADQLFNGDLFEDLPLEYVQSETDDWCMPRRIWLREMAVKLQYDFAKVCMSSGRTREALAHCQKALAIDPASEGANAEAMKVFAAQGRLDAMHRQYRQYLSALDTMGAREGVEIKALYRSLSGAA